jgi:hypothetical protein
MLAAISLSAPGGRLEESLMRDIAAQLKVAALKIQADGEKSA